MALTDPFFLTCELTYDSVAYHFFRPEKVAHGKDEVECHFPISSASVLH